MVANKTCKYAIVDGATALNAGATGYCRKVITTGKPMYWDGGSFIIPRGSDLVIPISKATVELRELGKLESLDEFFNKRGGCHMPSSAVLSYDKLRLFFILSYGACFVLFIIMLIDPQTPPGSKLRDGLRRNQQNVENENTDEADTSDSRTESME